MSEDQVKIEQQYYDNARFFVSYQTGIAIKRLDREEFITKISNLGYIVVAASGLVVVLMRTTGPIIEKSVTFAAALNRAINSAGPAASLRTVIVSLMELNSIKERARINTYIGAFEKVMLDRPASIKRHFSFAGLFAFNPLMRVTGEAREDYIANLIKAGYPQPPATLRTRLLTPSELEVYRTLYRDRDLQKMTTLDPIALWNNYNIGDVVLIECASLMTTSAIRIVVIIPPFARSTKSAKNETDNTEETDMD